MDPRTLRFPTCALRLRQYERLLSAFLGQVSAGAGQRDPNAAAYLHLSFGRNGSRKISGYGTWPPTPAGFADFVRGLTTAAKATAPAFPGNHFAEDHLAPISRSPRECITAPRAKRVPLRAHFDRVFKRELEHEWYPGWVAELDIARWVSDTRWPGGCYSRRPGSSCNESLTEATAPPPPLTPPPPSPWSLETAASICSARGAANDVGAKTPQGRLSARSCSLLPTYFTPELADLVSEYAADDLLAFDYPRWSPSPQTPAPLPGPPLHAGGAKVTHGCWCAWNATMWRGLTHLA